MWTLGAGLLIFTVANFPYWRTQVAYTLQPDLKVESAVTASPQMIPNLLIIEKLRIQTPIVYVDKIDEQVFQEGLKDGVVHYPGTAAIGESGNPYIFGHSSDYVWSKGRYKTIFARLPRIKVGDEIIVSNQEGKKFTYRVIETKVVHPKDLSVLDQQGFKKKLLTVQTSYPVGTALRRFVAIAELVQP